MSQQRRTKIVATLGPASESEAVLTQMMAAGLNLVRINFSHGSAEEQIKRIQTVRTVAKKMDLQIGIMADLQGPKIRVAKFRDKKILLKKDQLFILDANHDAATGTDEIVGIDYKELPQDVRPGDTLLLDDGKIVLLVQEVEGTRIITRVSVGGELSNNKGINRLGGGLSAAALTDKDKKDIITAVKAEVDYIAMSFPRDANDIHHGRSLIKQAGGENIGIIAKIERTEAVKNIDEIIEAADGVMVARGDLAVEIGEAEVPGVQKLIIQRARALNRPVITATQMMESMIESAVPTRAEVSDVANAVLDTTDAVMLSAETAVGKYPIKVIEIMARICIAAEKQPSTRTSRHRVEMEFHQIDEAIAMATVYTANHINVKAIIALTESGATPLMMSRIRTGIPIYGLSRHPRTLGKMTLYRDVYPIYCDVTQIDYEKINQGAVQTLLDRHLIQAEDLVLLTKGDHIGKHGATNTMKIIQVKEIF